MWEFNKYLKGSKAHIKAFPGATAKQLDYYSKQTLVEDIGCNDTALLPRKPPLHVTLAFAPLLKNKRMTCCFYQHPNMFPRLSINYYRPSPSLVITSGFVHNAHLIRLVPKRHAS